MLVDKVEALRQATEYWDRVRFGVRFDKVGAARELAASAVFSQKEISLILDTSVEFVKRVTADYKFARVNRLWNIRSVGALYMLALSYRAGGRINRNLLRRVVNDNNSIRAVQELTDIPIERIREVAND
jgi:hypothetical protein